MFRIAKEAPMLSAAEERTLAEAYRTGSQQALERLVTSHMRLVISIAQSYSRHGVPLDELISEGGLGLMEAAQRFEPERGVRFAVYAAWWVRAYIRRYTIANRRIVRTPSTRNARKLLARLRSTQREVAQRQGEPASHEVVAQILDVKPEDVETMDAVLGGRDVPLAGTVPAGEGWDVVDDGPSPEEHTAAEEMRAASSEALCRAFHALDEREREIVRRRYFDDEKASLSTIARSLGLSRERVRQLEHRAQHKMRQVMVLQVA